MPDSLHAISPIDGRYQSKSENLVQYFSEDKLLIIETYTQLYFNKIMH